MSEFIPVNEPLLNGNEKKYLAECIDTGWISSEGPFVSSFEKKFAKFVGRKHGIAVTNGTVAIDASIQALKIKAGDEIILPTFTIISCVLQIIRCGAKPVLVDCDPSTFNMNVDDIEAKITSRTRAIMVVHIYGLPVDMDPVNEICENYGLLLIEDAAETIGQTYLGRQCGSFGDISTVSFYPNKHITTGEGGMILTDDDELAERCRSIRNLCFQPNKRFIHDELGWNLRMTNVQAAIGIAQLERIEEFVCKKKHIGKEYNELLKETKGISLPITKTSYAENIYWVYTIVLSNEIKKNAHEAISILSQEGVGCRPFFYPLHKQPILLREGYFRDQELPISEHLYDKGFYIPSGLALTDRQQIKVVEKIKTFIRKCSKEKKL